MKNKTPLRLVAIDGESDDDSAAPTVEVQANDAITRKVPNPVAESEVSPATPPPSLIMVAPPRPIQAVPAPPRLTKTVLAPPRPIQEMPAPPLGKPINAATAVNATTSPPTLMSAVSSGKMKPSMKMAAIAGVAITLIAVLILALVARRPAPATAAAAAPSTGPATPPPSVAVVPGEAATAPAKPAAETIRLQVTATPIEATLSLDGNVVSGHALNLMVPRDRGIHVISASAPGYIPFNQQVGFDGDVVLTMNLHRGHTTVSRSSSRSRASMVESRKRVESPRMQTPPAAKATAGFEPGMNLEAPAIRPNAKAIDERNPYKP